jgi:hypothetical protein
VSRAGRHGLCLAIALAAVCAGMPARADRAPTPPPFEAQQVQQDSIRFALRVTDSNLIGATITNYGFVGNNFVSRAPSLEYPLGSGFEHMVRGGLWVGGIAIDDLGAFTGVVTSAVDGAHGSSSANATEFTPAGLEIGVRSTLPNNRFFNPNAVSEQDYLSTYSDFPAKRASGTGENHRPMGLLVRQENYAWSFSDFAHILFFRYVITNTGAPLANVHVGFYAEFASGPKNLYSTWPPSSSGSALGGWYGRKWIEYDDSLRLLREHYCRTLPIPGGCDLGIVPYWIGLKLLGVTPGDVSDTLDKRVTLAAWDWTPGSPLRDEDVERYEIMSAGTIQDLSEADLLPQTGDPVTLLAVGPFRQIDPGDSITVGFALVGGAEIEDIQRHARFAQNAYDRNYIVPVPPFSPRLKVVARGNALDLYWDNSSESAFDPTSPIGYDFTGYRVYFGEERLALSRIAEFDLAEAPHDTAGFNTGLDAIRLSPPEVIDGVTYHYRYTVPNLRDGFKYFCAVTAFDLGSVEIEPLESGIAQNKVLAIPSPAPGERPSTGVTVFPNPYRVEARWDQGQLMRDHYLWFANLPPRCTLRIYTLSGDVVFETEFDGASYAGQGARGIYDPQRELDVAAPTLSGGMFGWNLITRQGQAAATGLYMFAVEDRESGKRQVGKFLIVKSDREGLN